MEYLNRQWSQQQGRCHYLGLPLRFKRSFDGYPNAHLDRTDPLLGYVKGNVKWVHKVVNKMKSHYAEEYFVSLATMIAAKGGLSAERAKQNAMRWEARELHL